MHTWPLGTLTLGPHPAVCIALSKTPAQPLPPGADLVELRLDSISPEALDTPAWLAALGGLPRLATVRGAAERGAWTGTEAQRHAAYLRALPHCQAVDIEIAGREIRDSVIAAAKGAGALVIASFHDFDATPPRAQLDDLAAEARLAGADIVKVAAHCAAREDVATLAGFLLAQQADGAIVIGMGPAGAATRLLFPALGSLITYTFLGEPTAPGQYNLEATLRLLQELGLRG